MTPSTTIGAVLGVLFLNLRKQRKIQQGALAEKVGLTQPTWSKIERGQSAITLSQLAVASQALGYSPGSLLMLVDQSIELLGKSGVRIFYDLLNETEISERGGIEISRSSLIAMIDKMGLFEKKA